MMRAVHTPRQRRSGKYNARPCVVDGLRFASSAEGRRYRELVLLQAAGQIMGLRVQPKYPLQVNGSIIGSYIGDFEYHERGEKVLEVVKGVRTPVFALKARLVYALYGLTIRETGKGR